MTVGLRPEFLPQTIFRRAVLLAERENVDPSRYLGGRPILVHPDALRWYEGRLALARMRAHFALLDPDGDEGA